MGSRDTVTWHNFWSKIQQGQNILHVLNSAAVAIETLSFIWLGEDDSEMQRLCFYFLETNEG